MSKLILIFGGARSGKSSFAVARAEELSYGSSKVVYVATASPLDEEMKRRIEKHRKKRPRSWKTIEEGKDTTRILAKLGKASVIVVDCLTILISNLLLSGEREAAILNRITGLLKALKKKDSTTLVVSNEVGMGIVPGDRLSRSFRDIAGQVNQIAAQLADEVYLLEAGIPVKIKG